MGYVRHHVVVVTAESHEIEAARQHDIQLNLNPSLAVQSPAQGYWTILIPPSGAKQGRDTDNDVSKARDEFVNWLRISAESSDEDAPMFEWFECSYGVDYETAKLTRSRWD